jgi:RimJ/RimL family protein N-acetyltransferase
MAPLALPTALTDEVVSLRPWSAEDVPVIAGFGTDPESVRWDAAPAGYREDAARERIAVAEADRRAGRGISLAVTEVATGDVVGYVELRLPAPEVGELGYGLIATARGRGLMARALRLIVSWAVTEYRLARVQAFVSPDNAASIELLERLRFVREGLLRSYRGDGADRAAYSILRDGLAWPSERDASPTRRKP